MRAFILILTALLFTQTAFAQRNREIKWVNSDIPSVKGLEHKVLSSNSLGHDVGYVVWTPPGFDDSGTTRYPVVYFLHGAGGSEASDSGGFASRVATAIAQGRFPAAICVFPNGGMSGYRGDVERMIVGELIPLIDADYPTNSSTSARVVAGFSMGGAGSVSLAIQHPKLFCAAGSWGGALSWRGNGEDSPLLPAATQNAEALRDSNFALLTINGDQDHPDGFTPLAQTLEPLGISHTTVTLKDTDHNLGKYYESAGDTLIGFLAERLAAKSDSRDQSANRTIRVLTIGNSFAANACKYLKEIAADGGIDLVVGTANLGGCSLERHAALARQSAADPANRPYPSMPNLGQPKLSLQEYLRAEPWDYVTLQQMSALSHKRETYHPHVDELVVLIREHAPQAKILVHETWAYRPDAPLFNEWNITQDEMYEGLSKAYADVAQQFDMTIIPVGTAFQKARSTPGREVVVRDPSYDFENPVHPKRPNQKNSLVAGWYWDGKGDKPELRLDFKHANIAGCYLAGLVWYEALTGNDAREIGYAPKGVKDADKAFLREVAHDVTTASVNPASDQRLSRTKLTSDVRDGCRRESFMIASDVLNRDVQVRVVLPPSYDLDDGKSFPILYCLHGMGAPYATFSEMTELRARLAEKPVILAMFDGGVGSFYLDAAGDGNVDKSVLIRKPKEGGTLAGEGLNEALEAWTEIPDRIPSRYTSFFFDELVPAIDSEYRVDSQNRAVTGFSMGGFGAMHYMLEQPEFFKSVSGLSSAFYLRDEAEQSASRSGRSFVNKLGEPSSNPGNYDVVYQFERTEKAVQAGVRLPPVYQHCGTDDRLLDINERMAEHLKELNCSVEFVTSPGHHNWEFWRGAAPAMLDFHWKLFTNNEDENADALR